MAVLEADVWGYSKLVARDDSKTGWGMELRRRFFDKFAQQYDGKVVNQAGDSILVVFESALMAVRAAIEIQRDLERMNHPKDTDWPLHFRMGIDLGDVIFQGDQPVASAVNTAARLEALADPGGICVSGAVYGQVAGKVDVSFEDHGEQSLKNLPAPVHAYKARVYAPQEVAEPSSAGRDSPANIPSVPRLKRAPTDQERNSAMRDAFNRVRTLYEKSLRALQKENPGTESDFEEINSRRFVARVYVNGAEEAVATVSLANSIGGSSLQIFYSGEDQGTEGRGSFNECIDFAGRDELVFTATMGAHFFHSDGLDLGRLSPDQVAQYLWLRFIAPLTDR